MDARFSTKFSNKLLTKLIKLFFFKLYMKIMKTLGEDYLWKKFNEISSAEQLEFSW